MSGELGAPGSGSHLQESCPPTQAAELGPGEARRDLLGEYRRIAWELRTVNERVDAEAGKNALVSALLQHRQAELQSALEDAGGALDAAGIARPAPQDEAQESGDSPRKPGGKKRPKNLHPSAEPQAAELEEFDMFSSTDGQAPRGGDTGLVETERDRLIRLVRDQRNGGDIILRGESA